MFDTIDTIEKESLKGQNMKSTKCPGLDVKPVRVTINNHETEHSGALFYSSFVCAWYIDLCS